LYRLVQMRPRPHHEHKEREDMSQQHQLENKVAVITGGSSGIGKATALAFARENAKVVVSDISVEAAEETVRMIEALGSEATFVKADVAKESEIKALIQATVEAYGSLDCAVNNAGIEGDVIPIAESPLEDWERVIRINLTGVWLSMKYEIQQMLRQGGGAIVNMASMEGLIAFPGISPYVASKHGVNGITKTAALEYSQAKIRVNSVCPGVIDTGMIDRLEKPVPEIETLVAMSPAGRKGRPEEIAEAVIWLCSDAASFVNGHTMMVDGGYVIQ
jgi:NAD(P)-dependent dehydrogenase (short-subunit alcohol dehydrogenase family)